MCVAVEISKRTALSAATAQLGPLRSASAHQASTRTTQAKRRARSAPRATIAEVTHGVVLRRKKSVPRVTSVWLALLVPTLIPVQRAPTVLTQDARARPAAHRAPRRSTAHGPALQSKRTSAPMGTSAGRARRQLQVQRLARQTSGVRTVTNTRAQQASTTATMEPLTRASASPAHLDSYARTPTRAWLPVPPATTAWVEPTLTSSMV